MDLRFGSTVQAILSYVINDIVVKHIFYGKTATQIASGHCWAHFIWHPIRYNRNIFLKKKKNKQFNRSFCLTKKHINSRFEKLTLYLVNKSDSNMNFFGFVPFRVITTSPCSPRIASNCNKHEALKSLPYLPASYATPHHTSSTFHSPGTENDSNKSAPHNNFTCTRFPW